MSRTQASVKPSFPKLALRAAAPAAALALSAIAFLGKPTFANRVPVQGQNWQLLGPHNLKNNGGFFGSQPISGRVNGVGWSSSSASTIFAASATGGLLSSTNAGRTWSSAQGSDSWSTGYLSRMAIKGNIIFVGTGDFDANHWNGEFQSTPKAGVMRSMDGGTTWSLLGNEFAGSYVSSIAIDPDRNDLVRVTTGRGNIHGTNDGPSASDGVWQSVDMGLTWQECTPKINGVRANAAWSDIKSGAKNPTTGERTYFVTGVTGSPNNFGEQQAHLFRSVNFGDWEELVSSTITNASDWRLNKAGTPDWVPNPDWDPNNPNSPQYIHVRGCLNVNSVVAPSVTKAGTVYYVIGEVWGDWSVKDAQGKYSTAGNTFRYGSIFRSTDNGQTWTNITKNYPKQTSGSELDNCAVSATQTGCNFNWNGTLYNLRAAASSEGNDDMLYVGSLYLSACRGCTGDWQQIPDHHTDQHDIVVNPANPREVLAANDGGVYRIVYDPSKSPAWSTYSLDTTIGVSQVIGASFHPYDLGRALLGLNDNGAHSASGDLTKWTAESGGDGYAVALDFAQPSNKFIAFNGGIFGFGSTTAPADIAGGVHVMESSHKTPKRVFVARQNLWLYDAANAKWVSSTTPFGGTVPNRLTGTATAQVRIQTVAQDSVGSSNPICGSGISCGAGDVCRNSICVRPGERDYIGTNLGHIWLSTEAGAWTAVNMSGIYSQFHITYPDDPSLDNADPYAEIRAHWNVKSISVNPTDTRDILVGLNSDMYIGFGRPSDGRATLWRTRDATVSTPTWERVPLSGPKYPLYQPVNDIERDALDPLNTWYVGSDVGAYYTVNQGANWTPLNETFGLPPVPVKKLRAPKGSNFLTAATWGRGLWRLPLTGGSYPDLTITAVSSNDQNPSEGQSINLTATVSVANAAQFPRGTQSPPIQVPFMMNGTVIATGEVSNPTLDANNKFTVTASGPINLPNGRYTINATVDPLNRLAETSESNNGFTTTGTVTVFGRLTGTAFGTPPFSSGSTFGKAWDGNTSTFFDAQTGSGGYTGLTLGSARVLKRIRFFPRAGFLNRVPGGVFQGSNTSTSAGFTTLYTIPSTAVNGWNQVNIGNTTAYRYYRYLGPTNGFCNMAEIELYTSP